MAKKIVRGITDVKTITNQDFDTNNVNDLLSDGQYNYIHRKKGENEEYHNLTDNIKTLSSDNTELLTVTNNNKTTNSATLHTKHDAQKEQVTESTRDTITINHGENGTAEKTTVDTNPEKVLEHENLLTDYGISKNTTGNTTTLGLEYARVSNGFDLNNFVKGCVRCGEFVNSPKENTWFFVSAYTEGDYTIQEAIALLDDNNTIYRRLKANNGWGAWREQVTDKSVIDDLLAQKQDTLTAGTGITIQGNTISASAGATHTIQEFINRPAFSALKHVVTSGQQTLTTFTFSYFYQTSGSEVTGECVVTGELKEELKHYVLPNVTMSNGAISITYDGTDIKVINNKSTENALQQATFTFYGEPGSGGGGGGMS